MVPLARVVPVGWRSAVLTAIKGLHTAIFVSVAHPSSSSCGRSFGSVPAGAPSPRREPRVSMDHEGPSADCGLTPAAEGYGPSPVNNLVGNWS